MKRFFSYANNNRNYTQAVTLENVRSVHLVNGGGKSAIRFSVRIEYADNTQENFWSLEEAEAREVYLAIVKLLNEN